jgi:hypothetical protein
MDRHSTGHTEAIWPGFMRIFMRIHTQELKKKCEEFGTYGRPFQPKTRLHGKKGAQVVVFPAGLDWLL